MHAATGYDMSLGYLAYSRSHEVDQWRFRSFWYLYNFDRGRDICIAASAEPGQERQGHDAASVDCILPEIPVVLADREVGML